MSDAVAQKSAIFLPRNAALICPSAARLTRGYWNPSVGADSNSVPAWDKTNDTLVLYNWFATTAGSGRTSMSAYAVATDSICPSGWQLPTTSNNDTGPKSFYNLIVAGEQYASDFYEINSAAVEAIYGTPFNLVYPYLWSSRTHTGSTINTIAWHFGALRADNSVSVRHYNPMTLKFAVRCLKK